MNYLMLLIPAALWGSIGVFLDGISLSSTQIAFYRLLFASVTLVIIYSFSKEKATIKEIKQNIIKLAIAGSCIGLNWVALFEAYRQSSVSVATVVYYIAPIIVIVASPYIYKERLTVAKIFGITVAFFGLCAVTLSASTGEVSILGVLFALLGAFLYATASLINKSIKGMNGFNVAMFELMIGLVVVGLYTFVITAETPTYPGDKYMINLVILGVVHTGVAYGLFMTAIQRVPMQTTAICSFAEPLFAIIFSAVILGERMSLTQTIGAICIIGGAMFAEVYKGKKNEPKSLKK